MILCFHIYLSSGEGLEPHFNSIGFCGVVCGSLSAITITLKLKEGLLHFMMKII